MDTNIFRNARVIEKPKPALKKRKLFKDTPPLKPKQGSLKERMVEWQLKNQALDQQMIKDIMDVLNYKDGDYYVGGLATCHVVKVLGGKYGVDHISDLLNYADHSKIKEVYKYLRDYIKYMKKHPMTKCSCCGSVVHKRGA